MVVVKRSSIINLANCIDYNLSWFFRFVIVKYFYARTTKYKETNLLKLARLMLSNFQTKIYITYDIVNLY